MKHNHLKILLAGGGSGGPVMPVLAVAEEIKKMQPHTEFLFVGTRKGPERGMVKEINIPFEWIVATRFRRFLTLKNLVAPFLFVIGLIQAYRVVRKFKPNVVFSAGGFVAVPVCWAAYLLGVKIVIHQQDARVGLANKLIAPISDHITAAFEGTAKNFFSSSGLFTPKLKPRALWVGNPVRPELFDSKLDAKQVFNLHADLPVLVVLGGATGAVQINKLISEILPELVKSFQIVHQTGIGKMSTKFEHANYHPRELIKFKEYVAILRIADIVISRAGLSTIAELSALKKVAIVIPMPKTHQEDNAKILTVTGSAAILFGKDANSTVLFQVLNKIKFDHKLSEAFSHNMGLLMPKNAAEKIAKNILNNEATK